MDPNWTWRGQTWPFVDERGHEPAHFVLEQSADDAFEIVAGFTFDPGGADISVSSKSLVGTDLASIPLFLAWFVPINGRHTPAALVHDQLVRQSEQPGARRGARADADDVFIAAMASTDVPIVRRNVMYAAVTAATRWGTGGPARMGLFAWGAASLAGTAALMWGLATGRWWVVLAAAGAPALGGILWGRRNVGQGVLAGFTVWVIGLPALATLAGYGVYRVAEEVARTFAARSPDVTRAEVPRAAPYR